MTAEPLWIPSESQQNSSRMAEFIRYAKDREDGPQESGYEGLYKWSIDQSPSFWDAIWDYCGISGEKGSKPYLSDAPVMRKRRFFPDGKLNFAENLLRFRGEILLPWFSGVKIKQPAI